MPLPDPEVEADEEEEDDILASCWPGCCRGITEALCYLRVVMLARMLSWLLLVLLLSCSWLVSSASVALADEEVVELVEADVHDEAAAGDGRSITSLLGAVPLSESECLLGGIDLFCIARVRGCSRRFW